MNSRLRISKMIDILDSREKKILSMYFATLSYQTKHYKTMLKYPNCNKNNTRDAIAIIFQL